MVYASVPVRIEYVPETVQWTPMGERITPNPATTILYFEPQYLLYEQDRITFIQTDDARLLNKMYIITAVVPEWDSIGNVHHYVCQIAGH